VRASAWLSFIHDAVRQVIAVASGRTLPQHHSAEKQRRLGLTLRRGFEGIDAREHRSLHQCSDDFAGKNTGEQLFFCQRDAGS
jgi:hypothetical protein